MRIRFENHPRKPAAVIGLALVAILAMASSPGAQSEKFQVPQGELARIDKAATLVAAAKKCSLDTGLYFQKFMEIEEKLYSFEQVAFVGNYFGTITGSQLSRMPESINCDSVALELRKGLVDLNTVKFGARASKITDLAWYDLGPNGAVKRAVIYPVGESDHSILMIFFVNGRVDDFNIERVPEKIVSDDFDKAKWAKAAGSSRFPMAVSLVDSEVILGKTKDEITAILGPPDGTLIHEYGYTIRK
jgi:hypothetical protein